MCDTSSVLTSESTVPMWSASVVPSVAIVVSAVCATIAEVEVWTIEIIVSVAIVTIDGVVPGTMTPVYGVVEVVSCDEVAPLPVV